jgi:hypothetical protein
VTIVLAVGLVLLLLGGGDSGQSGERGGTPSGWSTFENERRGYTVSFPPEWSRADRNLTEGITDPVEILTLATFPLRGHDQLCGRRGALAEVRPDAALVTLQERGRGAYRGLDMPLRSGRFRPDPDLPGMSVWPYCAAGSERRRVPMDDYWFGFSDAGRAFHVLVAIGKEAPADARRDAFRILDSLRFDSSVKPDWRSSG